MLEGLDGAGTTTIASLLAETLEARGRQVRLTAEPTDGAFGRLLRRHIRREVTLDASTAALIFSADRSDHLNSLVRPTLRRQRLVVCDRYILSTLAYQGANGVSMDAVLAASVGFDRPDVTFFLTVPDDVRAERMSGRGRSDRYEDPELQELLRRGYAAAIHVLRRAGHRIEEIDATAGVDDVLATILARLDAAR